MAVQQLRRAGFLGIAASAALLAAPAASAQTLTTRSGARCSIERFVATATVEEGVANVTVEEHFRNPGRRPDEGVFRFRLPDDAVIGGFSMWMEGKEKRGEIRDAEEARATYDAIVQSRKDPGLLEQVGWRDFQVSVFPIPANDVVRIRLDYAHVVRDDLGIEVLELPLPAESGPIGDLSVDVRWSSARGLAGLDSPSHPDAVLGPEEGVGVARIRGDGSVPAPAVVLRAIPRSRGFDVALLTHRPAGAEEGYWLARLVPRLEAPTPIGRDLVFVMDTSGSMAGRKFEQARQALLTGLDSLGPHDRFAIVAFASEVTRFASRDLMWSLVPATKEWLADARRFVAGLGPTGGTDIAGALTAAADLLESRHDRLRSVIFLTDGDPTIGEQRPEAILAQWLERSRGARLFAFGVGDGVKEFLLTELATLGRGAARYVREGDDLELPLSALYERIRTPLLLDPEFDVRSDGTAGVMVTSREPVQLPDVCQRRALVMHGRYRGHGKATLRLRGEGGDGRIDLEVQVDFPEQTLARPHVAQLWARARVDRLLDALRIGGQDRALADELVAEVRGLGLTHQIVTPWTSFLVLEDEFKSAADAEAPREVRVADDGTTHDRLPAAPSTTPSVAPSATPSAAGSATRLGGPGDTVPPGIGGGGDTTPPATRGGTPSADGNGFLAGRGRAVEAGRGPAGPTTGGLGGRRGRGEGFERWEFWWEHNKDEFLAAARTPAPPPLPLELRRELLPALIEALDSTEAEIADAAALALARMAAPERESTGRHVVPALVRALGHPSSLVQRTATLALGLTGHEDAIAPLRGLLGGTDAARDVDDAPVPPEQRALAAAALGQLRAAAAIDDLFQVLDDVTLNRALDLKALAVLALGRMETRTAEITARLLALLDERAVNTYVRAQAPIALHRLAAGGASEPREALVQLTKLMRSDRTETELRRSLVIAVGRLATMGDGDADLHAREWLAHLVEKCNDDQSRHFALLALAELGARDPAPAAHHDAHEKIQRLLHQQLVAPKRITHQPIAALATGLYWRQPGHGEAQRLAAGAELAECFDQTANPSYRAAMAVGLGLLRHRAAGKPLLEAHASTRDAALRGYIALALGLMGDRDATAPLREAFGSPKTAHPPERLQLARALGLLDDGKAAGMLVAGISSATTLSESVSCTQALGMLRDAEGVRQLLQVATDPARTALERGLAWSALGLAADRSPLPWNAAWSRDTNYRAKVSMLAELLDLP